MIWGDDAQADRNTGKQTLAISSNRRLGFLEVIRYLLVDGGLMEGGFDFVGQPGIEQVVRNGPKIGRNDPCPCGSGKKFKKCCVADGAPSTLH